MSPSPEVDFILTAINDNYGSALADVPLQRIDRDNSKNIDTGERVMADKDYRDNFVGVATVENPREPFGTEFNYHLQHGLNLWLKGTHHTQHGQVDPDGVNGAVWKDMKDNITDAIQQVQEFPNVSNRPDRDYLHIFITNENDLSKDYKDKYHWDIDLLFYGEETTG